MSEPLTAILPEDVVYMPVVITGALVENAVPEYYLSLAMGTNKEMELFLNRDTAITVCAQIFATPVLLFEVSLEDAALVRESTIANLALKIYEHSNKLFKIESDFIETLTIHSIMKFGFPIQLT